MSIVNNALAFPNCEAPGAAAPDIKPVQDSTASSTTGPGFAKELKDCESKAPPEEQKTEMQKPGQKKEEKGDAEKNDNGMPDVPGATVAMYGIVGILEGFEPPGYQSDNTASNGEVTIAPISPQTVIQTSSGAQAPQNSQPAAQNNSALQTSKDQAAASGAGSGELPEQIAWMLQNNQAGTKPVQTQDEILKIVGEYLDSLENTNSQAAGDVPDGQAAVVKSGAGNVQNSTAAAVTTDAETPEGTKTPEGVRVPERAAKIADVRASEAGPPEVMPEQAAKDVKPAAVMAQQGEAIPKEAKAQAADAKPVETGKPENRTAVETRGAEIVNTAQTTAYKAETETAVPVNAEAKPETVRESVLKIVDKVKTEASEGRYDFDIDLKPDFMGKVSIKLTMEGGSVKVQIKADDAATKVMLSDQTTNLHMMLKEKGIPVTTIDVAYNGEMTSGREESRGQFDRRNPQSGYTYEPSAEGTFDSAKEKYDFYLGGSYVEYLA